jgi:hypothetical protein
MSYCVLHSVGVKLVGVYRTKDRSAQLILLLLSGIEHRTGVHNNSFYSYIVE